MMNPVFRALAQRADSRRHSLLELAHAIPGEYLERVAPGDDWNARFHLVHALGIDAPTTALVLAVASGADSVELATTMSQLTEARSETLRAREHLKLDDLLETAIEERRRLIESMSRLGLHHLDVMLPVPGARNSWGEPVAITVFHYLDQWAAHDSVHEESIRLAIATKPDLSTVALTRRLR